MRTIYSLLYGHAFLPGSKMMALVGQWGAEHGRLHFLILKEQWPGHSSIVKNRPTQYCSRWRTYSTSRPRFTG